MDTRRIRGVVAALDCVLVAANARAGGPFLKESARCSIFDLGLGLGSDDFGSLQLDAKGTFTGKLQMIAPYHMNVRFPATLSCWVECNGGAIWRTPVWPVRAE